MNNQELEKSFGDMNGKVVLITGANSGIGKVTALELARLGATVLASGRDREKLEAAVEEIRRESGNQKVHALVADLSSMKEVARLADQVLQKTDRLDVLINNAGVMLSRREETEEGLETTFAVNHLAPYLLTTRLLPLLRASAPARVINVASGWHKSADGLVFDDLQYHKCYDGKVAYQRSKLANILFTRALDRRLQGSGVTANSLHPGVVRTRFGRDGDVTGVSGFAIRLAQPFLLSPEQGARTSLYLASSPELEGVSGKYFSKSKEAVPSRAARDDTAAERLWQESEELVGLILDGGRIETQSAESNSCRYSP